MCSHLTLEFSSLLSCIFRTDSDIRWQTQATLTVLSTAPHVWSVSPDEGLSGTGTHPQNSHFIRKSWECTPPSQGPWGPQPLQGRPAEMHLALAVPSSPREQGASSQGCLTLRCRVLCALPPLPLPSLKERGQRGPSPADGCPSVCPAD